MSRDSLIALGGAALGAGAVLLAQKSAKDFFGSEERPSLTRMLSFKTPPCIVIVDPLSTGVMLARLLQDRGYAVIRVYSGVFDEKLIEFVPKNIEKVEWHATIYHDTENEPSSSTTASSSPPSPTTTSNLDKSSPKYKELALSHTMSKILSIKGVHIEGFMVGCESGVELCDLLTERFTKDFPGTHVLTNGTKMSKARRDKYDMGEAVRNAGVRAVGQIETQKFEDVLKFIDEVKDPKTGEFKVVLKPAMSAGSEGVYFCESLEECRKYFDEIYMAVNVFGEVNDKVLCQEFLAGKEYVVDSVSVEGIHKTVAIWEYDKRAANGAKFVYYGMRLFETDTGMVEDQLVSYMHKVLDALDVKHGPSHGEVMLTSTGPCLVEVGCRPHGGEGTFVKLADGPIGYNQLSVMVDSHENRSKFYRLPTRPLKLKMASMEVCLVNSAAGKLKALPGIEAVKSLKSFIEFEQKINIGDAICATTDFLTSPGSVMLLHESKDVVEADQEFIHKMEGLLAVEAVGEDGENKNRVRLDSLK